MSLVSFYVLKGVKKWIDISSQDVLSEEEVSSTMTGP